ncbi:cytochrome P450 [Gautieria morchelliformis]|nr:cytochrome P450 [Gautieria morchelliformis]
MSALGSTIPTFWWNPGLYFVWDWKDSPVYKKRGSEVVAFIPLVYGRSMLYTTSPEVIQQILGYDSTFQKPDFALALDLLGANVVASNGEQWRRHRKVTAPAFHQSTYRNVWLETARIYEDMLNTEGWNAADTFSTPSFNQATTKVALLVIAACGFGIPLPWSSPSNGLSIRESIVTVASSILIRVYTPRLAYFLPITRLQKVDKAYTEFERFMKEHIASRKTEIKKMLALGNGVDEKVGSDIFGRLVQASETEGRLGLADQELLGNCFIFLFAGHETTAHTLAVTLALLGMHQDEQDRVYRHIRDLLNTGRQLSFEDSGALTPVLSCFYEALRLYPAAYVAIREATEETVLTYPSISHPGTDEHLLVPVGSQIVLDMVNANRNPRHFPDPDKFRPSRWDQSTDSFFAFSLGPRACLGRKFATTEATCFLSHLLRDWRVEIVRREGETDAQWESRVLYPKMAVTLTTGDVPLRFIRREV